MNELIDITNPQNYANFVDKDGYVWYAGAGGRAGFHVSTPYNAGCGWWGKEHFKADDYHIKSKIPGTIVATLIPVSEL